MKRISGGTFIVLVLGVLVSFTAGYVLKGNVAGATAVPVLERAAVAPLVVANQTPDPTKAKAGASLKCSSGWAKDGYGYCFEIANLQQWSTQSDPTGDAAFANFLNCLMHEPSSAGVDVQSSCLKNFYPAYY